MFNSGIRRKLRFRLSRNILGVQLIPREHSHNSPGLLLLQSQQNRGYCLPIRRTTPHLQDNPSGRHNTRAFVPGQSVRGSFVLVDGRAAIFVLL